MIKKILAFASGTLLSMSAQAGYVMYELSPTTPGGFTSSVVIREEDKSVAYYVLRSQFGIYIPSEIGEGYHYNELIETTTSFTGLGPTNIYTRDIMPEEYSAQIWLMFGSTADPLTFSYSMRVLTKEGPETPRQYITIPTRDLNYSGTAKRIAMDPFFASYIDSSRFNLQRDIPYYDPTQVPEPTSLALLAIGVLGAAGAAGRRNAQSKQID